MNDIKARMLRHRRRTRLGMTPRYEPDADEQAEAEDEEGWRNDCDHRDSLRIWWMTCTEPSVHGYRLEAICGDCGHSDWMPLTWYTQEMDDLEIYLTPRSPASYAAF